MGVRLGIMQRMGRGSATEPWPTFSVLVAERLVPEPGAFQMRLFTLLCCAAVVAGCAKADTPAADTTPAVVTPPPPQAIALADVAGTWDVKGMAETGDSVLTTYVFNATPDSTKWTITFPNGRPIPVRIMGVAGDSISIHAGPYASVLRKGVQVQSSGAMRLQDGKLMGTQTARYSVKTADSVLVVRTEGTRRP